MALTFEQEVELQNLKAKHKEQYELLRHNNKMAEVREEMRLAVLLIDAKEKSDEV